MPEDQKKAQPEEAKPAPAAPPDAGHIPMSEELDSPAWTLPPPKAIGIGLAVFAVLAALVFFLTRAQPVASGSIDKVIAVSPTQDQVMVAIHVSFTNVLPEKPLWVRSASARLTKADGQQMTDTAASIVDFDRYFEAFPDLKEGAIEPLRPESKLAPGEKSRGMVIVSFPVDKQTFEQRKELVVLLDPYDQPPVTIGAEP
jgi:hypothetical protein